MCEALTKTYQNLLSTKYPDFMRQTLEPSRTAFKVHPATTTAPNDLHIFHCEVDGVARAGERNFVDRFSVKHHPWRMGLQPEIDVWQGYSDTSCTVAQSYLQTLTGTHAHTYSTCAVYVHTYIHIRIDTKALYISSFRELHTHTHEHIHCTCTRTCICTRMHMFTYTHYLHMHVHVHIHTVIHIPFHIHMPSLAYYTCPWAAYRFHLDFISSYPIVFEHTYIIVHDRTLFDFTFISISLYYIILCYCSILFFESCNFLNVAGFRHVHIIL